MFPEWQSALQQVRVPGDVAVQGVRGALPLPPRHPQPRRQLALTEVQVSSGILSSTLYFDIQNNNNNHYFKQTECKRLSSIWMLQAEVGWGGGAGAGATD